MTNIRIVGTNTLLNVCESMYKRGEITHSQICEIRARAEKVPAEHKKDVFDLDDDFLERIESVPAGLYRY